MRRTPLNRFTPLKAKTRLKAKSPLKPMSEKNKVEREAWIAVKRERMKLLIAKYGCVLCEYCKRQINHGEFPDAHHANRHRNGLENNTLGNARLLHRACHEIVTDHNIDVPSLL